MMMMCSVPAKDFSLGPVQLLLGYFGAEVISDAYMCLWQHREQNEWKPLFHWESFAPTYVNILPNVHLMALIGTLHDVYIYRIVSNKCSPSNKRPPNLFSNKN